jgi:hypothetical protein
MTIRFPSRKPALEPSSAPGPLMAALREKTVPNLVWRFYIDEDHKWKWQHLSMHGEVIAQSARSYKNYENCLANARENGHVFEPAQAKTRSVETAPFYPK